MEILERGETAVALDRFNRLRKGEKVEPWSETEAAG